MRVQAVAAALLFLLSILPTAAEAQLVGGRGSATFTYGPAVCGTAQGVDKKGAPIKECRQPTPLDFQEVQRRAALSAVERFVAEGGEDQSRAFDRIRDSVRTHLDEIVISVAELNRAIDENSRQITMAVRVEINESRLRNLLQATSNIARAGTDKSLMGMFLLAREQISIEAIGPERRSAMATRASDAAASSSSSSKDTTFKAKEGESLRGGTATFSGAIAATGGNKSASANQTETSASTVESSSTITRAAIVQYKESSAGALDAVIGGRLAAAGYETVDGGFLEDDATPALVAAVRADFGTGEDLKASTLRRIAAAAIKLDVKFALIGTVDMSLPGTDEVSGKPRVYAKVQAKVYDVSGRLPRTLVNVGPAQYAGTGPTADVARTNALKNAANEIARAVVDQLSNKQAR